MKAIRNDWNFMRIIRLVLGVAILMQGIIVKDTFTAIVGFAFGAMAMFNISVCGVNGCHVPRKQHVETEDVEFEELQQD